MNDQEEKDMLSSIKKEEQARRLEGFNRFVKISLIIFGILVLLFGGCIMLLNDMSFS